MICNCIRVFGHGHRLRPNNSFKPRPLRGSACVLACSTPPFRAAVRLNSGVRPRQSDLRNKSNSARLFRNVPRRYARAPLAYSPSDTFKRARQMFIRRRRCGLSLRSFVPGYSPAGARGNKPCRACLRASVRFLRHHCRVWPQEQRLVSGLTIRSSRVRFAASAPAAMIQPPPWPLRCPA